MVEREPMGIDRWGRIIFLFWMEGTTGITCQRTATIHVCFDTRLEHLWVSERSVASCMARADVSCEVTDASPERLN